MQWGEPREGKGVAEMNFCHIKDEIYDNSVSMFHVESESVGKN